MFHLVSTNGVVAREGRVSAEEYVHSNAQAPEVAPLVVVEVLLGVLDEGLHNLRSHELCAAHRGVEEGRGVRASPWKY